MISSSFLSLTAYETDSSGYNQDVENLVGIPGGGTESGMKRQIWMAAGVIVCVCILWTACAERQAHRDPGVKRRDIEEIVKKDMLTREDYRILGEQTGLSEKALISLAEAGRTGELELLQERYFAPVSVRCTANTLISREEYLVDQNGRISRGMQIPYVEDGDILITCCSHVLGWRNGHAGLVVDAKQGKVLEAQVLGKPSVVNSLERWECYPSFLVLRLKGADQEERGKIADYAMEHLKGVEYRLSAGIWDRDAQEVTGTQCAHLVWYAYRQFGYELDSDGGRIVTPSDIARCEALEVIQSYGR